MSVSPVSFGTSVPPEAPLTQKDRALFRLGVAFGAHREAEVRAFTRNVLEAGWTPEELRYAVQVATQSFAAPQMLTAAMWVEEALLKQAGVAARKEP